MCSNQLSYSGFSNPVLSVFGVQIYSKNSFPQNYCAFFCEKMYLCIHTNSDMKNPSIAIAFILCMLCTTGASAQQQLSFEPAVWDFGSIKETDGPVSHTFTGRNTTDRPLVILDVTTTCGCTVPSFSRKPVLPGAETQITATYDPADRPGSFDRELWVYSSDRKRIATLTIRGSVIPRKKNVEELYPVDAGGGLRLTSTTCVFTYVYPGIRAQSAVSCINTSDRAITVELRPDPGIRSGLLQTESPKRLEAGMHGQINLSYLIPAESPRYGTLRDALELFVDGKSRGVVIVAHGIGADNPADMPKGRAPRSEVSENVVKFGTIRSGAPIQTRTLTLTNSGNEELIVRAVECGKALSCSLEAGTKIPAGGSREVEVLFDPSGPGYGARSSFLLLITNDPLRPMRRIRTTAVIED